MTDSPNDCELFGRGYIEVPRTPAGPPEGYGPETEFLPPGAIESQEVLPEAPGAAPQGEPQASRRRGGGREAAARPAQPARARTTGTSGATERRAPTGGGGTAGRRTTPAQPVSTAQEQSSPGFIGPTGYDMHE